MDAEVLDEVGPNYNLHQYLISGRHGSGESGLIQDRPKHLLVAPDYRTLPPLPYSVDWSSIPELVRSSIADLSGIQPITGGMAEAADGMLFDRPGAREIEFFRKRGTQFQMISVVANLVATPARDEPLKGLPFALTLIPASKRGKVAHCSIELIERLDADEWLKTGPAYVGYDPFSGESTWYGALEALPLDDVFLDEIGIVAGQFFLATEFDFDDVSVMDIGLPTETVQKYLSRRTRLLFTPFKRVEARRIWGAESPIELFLIQELARRGLFPQLQMLIASDGSVFPSWYHFWRDIELRYAPGLVTEADLFFPKHRVAVFCDGRTHFRRKQREKDKAINDTLVSLGIKPVRFSGRDIIFDLENVANRLCCELN